MKLSSLLGAAAAAATLNLHVAPAAGQIQDGAFEVVSDDELAEHRGGYLLADELAFQFGAVMRTFENGALSLETQLVWTPDGPMLEQVLGEGVTQLTAAELSSVGLGETYVTPGGSVVMHELAQGQLVNLLTNTYSDRSYRQEVDITLVLPGFGETQADMGRQLTGLRLVDELSFGSISALGGL